MNAAAKSDLPDAQGHFGPYGGRYVPETLMHPLQELEAEYFRAHRINANDGRRDERASEHLGGQREVPGIAEAIREDARGRTPHALLSRGLAGLCGATLVVNLPGSEKAAVSCTTILLPVMPHAVKMLAGGGH